MELIEATTGATYSHVSSTMSTEHATLLALLFAVERMLASQQMTKHELMLFVEGLSRTTTDDSCHSQLDMVTVICNVSTDAY